MAEGVVDHLEMVKVEHHDGYRVIVLLAEGQCIMQLRLDLSVVVYACQRIGDGQFLVFLQGRERLHRILVDVLDEEDEPVVISVIGLRAAECQLDPNEVSFKVAHHAVV